LSKESEEIPEKSMESVSQMPDTLRTVAEQKFEHHTLSALYQYFGVAGVQSSQRLRLHLELPMDVAV
jgi:hypothetical protein